MYVNTPLVVSEHLVPGWWKTFKGVLHHPIFNSVVYEHITTTQIW